MNPLLIGWIILGCVSWGVILFIGAGGLEKRKVSIDKGSK